ncbi:PRKR-interacting protein 1-like [Hibiscus syriacus]|uniref:PRKR-interacting protein 1-like n=1 Tax=Hibiscus syriacus TaxID=106335 RepID=A0A6A3ARL4_HIBSY|nr:PRKR-interacting protein 1-like [Hibiscus syriacus]
MGDSNLSHRTSVHKALGGGRVADLLLWRRWCGGAMLLVSATTMYYLFEIAGYDFLPLWPTFCCSLLLFSSLGQICFTSQQTFATDS